MKALKFIFFAMLVFAVSAAKAGDIRMGITPNPANNQISIVIEGIPATAQQYPEIYTVLGEKVVSAQCRKEGSTYIFNTSALPDGVYLVKYGTGNQAVVKRLKIQHQ